MATGSITTLLSSGADAFTNLFDASIIWPKRIVSDGGEDKSATVRCLGFTAPPNQTVPTYPVKYKAVTLQKPGATIEGERTFSLRFRSDSSYELYRKFMNWKHLLVDPSGETSLALNKFYNLGTGAADEDLTGRIKVFALKPDATAFTDSPVSTALWDFLDVVCTDVVLDSFTRDSSAAATFEVKFMFARFKEPYTSITTHTEVPSSEDAIEPAE